MRIFLIIIFTLFALSYFAQSLNKDEDNRYCYIAATCFIATLLFFLYRLGGA
jgi:hypothetical protein